MAKYVPPHQNQILCSIVVRTKTSQIIYIPPLFEMAPSKEDHMRKVYVLRKLVLGGGADAVHPIAANSNVDPIFYWMRSDIYNKS